MSVLHVLRLTDRKARAVAAVGASPVAPLPIALGFDGANPDHLCVRCPITGPIPADTYVQLQCKLAGTQTWRDHMLLSRIRMDEIDATGGLPAVLVGKVTESFVGMAFYPAPASTTATPLDVRLAIYMPGQPTQYVTGTHYLRALHPVAGPVTHTCTPATFATVYASLPAQYHLRMSPGTYTWSNLQFTKGGLSAAAPSFVTAAALGDVIINTPTGIALQPQADNVVFERLRFTGSGLDTGSFNTASEWLLIGSSNLGRKNWSIDDCDVLGFDRGAVSFAALENFDIRRTRLVGNKAWARAFQPGGFGQTGNNDTWNNHGICLPGVGNSAVQCLIKGHGDAWRTYANASSNVFTAGCGTTMCDTRECGDDMGEFDGGSGNNYMADARGVNVGNGFSCDGTYGPSFVVRALVINASRGPFKYTSYSRSARVMNSTFVLTVKGPADHGLLTPGSGDDYDPEMTNCAVVYAGAGGVLRWDNATFRRKVRNNAYYPDRGFQYRNGGVYATLAAAKLGDPVTYGTDVLLAAQPFAAAITLGADTTTQYVGQLDATFAAGSAARNAGVVLPGITDGFSGSAPDIGCVISGRAPVEYGVPAALGLPSYVPAFSATVGNVNVLTVANGGLANEFVSICAPTHNPFYFAKTVNDYSGGTPAPDYGTYGAVLFFGGGHSGTNDNTLSAQVHGATQVSFKRVIDPTDIFGAHIAGGGASPVLSNQDRQQLNSNGNFNNTSTFGDALGIARVDGTFACFLLDGKPGAPHTYASAYMQPPTQGGAVHGTFVVPTLGAVNRDTSETTASVTTYKVALTSTSTSSTVNGWVRTHKHPTIPSATENRNELLSQAPIPPLCVWDSIHARGIWQVRGKPARFNYPDGTSPNATYGQSTGDALDSTDMHYAPLRLVAVPERGLLVMLYQKTSTGMLGVKYALNTVNPSWVAADPPLGLQVAVGLHWTCGDWCPDSPGGGAFIIGDLQGNTAQYLEMRIPTVLTNSWPCELVNYSSPVAFPVPASADNSSINGRWSYHSKLKCIPVMLKGEDITKVHMIRPRGV